MLYNVSLFIDDIEDNLKFRRGFLVVYSIYGILFVINFVNYVYFFGLEKVLIFEYLDVVKFFIR